VARLLRELPDSVQVSEDLVDKGRVLDTFDVPSRYPNSHSEGAPFEHYGPLQSGEGTRYAREVIEFVRAQMA
jgi:HEPN domain-containing protein